MKSLTALAAACVLLVASAESRAADIALETTAADIVLPLKPPSTLAVTPCLKCAPILLLTSRHTSYAVNDQPVELEELRRRLAGRPGAHVGLTYDSRTRELRDVRALVY
jgi:hypothetical protein